MSSDTAVFVLREQALAVGEKLSAQLDARLIKAWQVDASPKELFQREFRNQRSWVLLMSAGIAVRFLDGLPQDKHTDPAVVTLDDGCHHAIALLSGHEGGANQLAYSVANIVGATPVITTATESCKPLVVGIGCRKDVASEDVARAVHNALGDRSLDEVRCIATIDLKADEPGLLQFCRSHDLPMRVISRRSVAARNWVSKPSAWVQTSVGVDGVCEPCALIAAPRGRLVVPKTALDGVAVAVVEDWLS